MPKRRPPLTDEEGEVRELTAEDFKGMRPLREVDPGFIAAMEQFRKKVGRPKAASPKVHISFRLAAEVVESIKATGEGYNARVEQALRDAFVTGSASEAKLKEMSKSKSVRAMKLPRVGSKIMERSYQRSGVVAGGTLLSSGARQAESVGFRPVEANRRPHFGSSLKDFLEAEGLLEEATEHAIKAVAAWLDEAAPKPAHHPKAPPPSRARR
jgi:uncharacterized protein (DUF4415 family)